MSKFLKQWPERFCPVCHQKLYRKRGPKTRCLESSTNFLRRITCGSKKCVSTILTNPSATSRSHRRRARKNFLKDHCERCGYKPKNLSELEVHHIDGDWHNNNASNLRTLCKSPCHKIEDLEKNRGSYREYDSGF